MDNWAFTKLSYGLYVISAWDNGRPTGCTANSAMQISDQEPTIAVSINKNHFTNACIQEARKFSISVLGENTDPLIIGTFGFKSGKTENKFDSVDYSVKNHMPVLDCAAAYFTCDVVDKMEDASHTVFLGKVTDAQILSDDRPMTYDYYHRVIKNKN